MRRQQLQQQQQLDGVMMMNMYIMHEIVYAGSLSTAVCYYFLFGCNYLIF